MMNRQQWIAGFLLLFVFLFGATVGGVGVHFAYRLAFRPPPPVDREPPPPLPGRSLDRYERTLVRELHLSPEQEAAVRGVLRDSSARFDAVHRQTRERVVDLLNETSASIRMLLDPQQRETFEQIQERQRQWMRERMDRPGPRAGAPGGGRLWNRPPDLPPPEGN